MINIQQNSLPSINVVPDKLPLATLAFPGQSASLNFSFSKLLFDFSVSVISIERTIDELIIKAKVHTFIPATIEQLSKLPLKPIIETISFAPKEVEKEVLNQVISLGPQILTLKDAILKNFYSVKQEIAQNDGHLVDAVFKTAVALQLIGAEAKSEKMITF